MWENRGQSRWKTSTPSYGTAYPWHSSIGRPRQNQETRRDIAESRHRWRPVGRLLRSKMALPPPIAGSHIRLVRQGEVGITRFGIISCPWSESRGCQEVAPPTGTAIVQIHGGGDPTLTAKPKKTSDQNKGGRRNSSNLTCTCPKCGRKGHDEDHCFCQASRPEARLVQGTRD